MHLNLEKRCDVLVIGSGIAGITAAIHAAESGKTVILACKGKLFSGSSFYPGTWGLGLIGPSDKEDEEDLIKSIEAVGCKVADHEMVSNFVAGIPFAIDRIRKMGIHLRRANNAGQKEYIPCFDHKHRDWNGLEFESSRKVFSDKILSLQIKVLSNYEIIELAKVDNRVCGEIFSDGSNLHYIGCKSMVLATGGYGSIFKYHLCTEDVEGIGQSLALHAGCTLVNMEFMQMMPGYISPAYQTIFNEKVFKYTKFQKRNGSSLLEMKDAHALAIRSTHGPFTSRLESKEIDIALFKNFMEDETGVCASYTSELQENTPEFIKTYFDWLFATKGLTVKDSIHVGIFAHAANGGIRIRPNASTGIDGLYAAGEVTGGMHGADRIGGLSTANGLVFGTRAGISASDACAEASEPVSEYESDTYGYDNCEKNFVKLKDIMFQNAMVIRNGKAIEKALQELSEIRATLCPVRTEDVKKIAEARRISARITTAECILRAASLRCESRGSHYRDDYPEQNPDMARPITIKMVNGQIRTQFS